MQCAMLFCWGVLLRTAVQHPAEAVSGSMNLTQRLRAFLRLPSHLGARWTIQHRGQQLRALSPLRTLALQGQGERAVLRGAAKSGRRRLHE